MYDAEKLIKGREGRNTVQGNYKTLEQGCLPDQSRQGQFIKELIELRAVQNNIKNKLRKVLFSADTCKVYIICGH